MMPRRWMDWTLVIAVLAPLYIYGGFVVWSLLFDSEVPINYTYQHHSFVGCPTDNRKDAEKCSVQEARSGTTVYRYVEYCIGNSKRGEIQGNWVNGQVILLPPSPTISQVGCFKRSFPVTVPIIYEEHLMVYNQRIVYELNAFKTLAVVLNPLQLMVRP